MFTKRLAEYINLNISGVSCYAETAPSVKDTSGHTVIVSNAGQSGFKSTTFYASIRFMVSGTAASSIEKAEQMFLYFCPFGITNGSKRFEANEYAIIRAIPDNGIALASNIGNIFWASFSINFLISRDTN